LTDLHFTGQVKREFFEFAVEKANEFRPDLVFITGDIVDEPECLDWIGPVFSKLRSRHGSYYVLGNHDRRIRDEALLRKHLEQTGLIRTSGTWHELTIRGARLEISGNDLPWYRGAENLQIRKKESNATSCRILLSHSPDQIDWAVQHGFDLVFAGHTHGGQIRLPVIGPIIAPSRYGVRYASGDFSRGSTLMHVSRGISGDDPIRLLCPPELGLFILKVPATGDSKHD
jgi:predicted MPP superfamily phosphohydrolase